MSREKLAGVEIVPLTQYDIHTIITALEFRAGLWDSEISGASDADENSRDYKLALRLAEFKTK